MRTLTPFALVACLIATPCLAQNATTTTTTGTTKALPGDSTGSLDKVVPGANSFTEGQARSRAEAAGFTGIQSLLKDDKGIWRGQAMRDGKQVAVAIDYKGDVTAN